MMQGGSAISQDLPPFCVALRANEICGLNVVGLRRANISSGERLELKKIYHLFFRGGKNLREALAEAQNFFNSAPAKILLEFVSNAKRGLCSDTGRTNNEVEDA